MLLLGLGTGPGSALIAERVIVPLELGSLPFCATETIAERGGNDGALTGGFRLWEERANRTIAATISHYHAPGVCCRSARIDVLAHALSGPGHRLR